MKPTTTSIYTYSLNQMKRRYNNEFKHISNMDYAILNYYNMQKCINPQPPKWKIVLLKIKKLIL
jgi:hypothetical protein